MATLAGVLSIRVLDCEDKLENRAVKPIQLCVKCVSEFLG
jgi:hypothetical protein